MSNQVQTASNVVSSAAGLESVEEHREERALKVEGRVPEWLEGVLYRTGPGQYEVKNTKGQVAYDVKHWFDGKALNHRFALSGRDNRVTYRSRFACSDQLAKEERLEHPSSVMFAQPHDPCERLYTKFNVAFHTLKGAQDDPTSPSNTNVNVVIQYDHQNRTLLTRTDANALQRLDPTTLEPIQAFDYAQFDKRLNGHLSAAHAATIDGTSYNFLLNFGPAPSYKIFSIDQKGNVNILTRIHDAPAAYLHSLAATESYVVLSVWQADIKFRGILVPWKNNVLENIGAWSPGRKTIHYVVDRRTGTLVKKCTTDAFFCFHHINAFETDDKRRIVLDLATFDDTSIMHTLYLDQLRKFDSTTAPKPSYRRIVLSLDDNDGKADQGVRSRRPRDDINLELPTVHPDKKWRKVRFTYGVHHTSAPESRHLFLDSIIKLDMDHPSLDDNDKKQKDEDTSAYSKVWKGNGMVPGEPIFVPRPGGVEEDDGVVLTIALDVHAPMHNRCK